MSVRFLADENFNNRIVLGLRRRDESIDIALVQDVGLRTADDPTVGARVGERAGRPSYSPACRSCRATSTP